MTAAVKARPQMGAQGCRRSLEVGQGGLSTMAATPKRESAALEKAIDEGVQEGVAV